MARERAAGRAAALFAAFALAGCDTLSDWIGWGVSDDAPPRVSDLPQAAPSAEPAPAPARRPSTPAATAALPPAAAATPPREPYAYGAVVRPTATPNAVSAPTPVSAPSFGPAEAFVAEAGDRVFFAENDARIGPRGRAVLERQALWLRANPGLLATVVGHAGEEGERLTRAALAFERADRVRAFLIEAGVAPDRLVAVVFSDRQPFASPTTAAGRALNRRAVTVITPK